MSQKMFGMVIETADNASPPAVFQPIIFERDVSLLAARVKLIAYNDPTFTTVELRCYANRAGAPGKILYTSSRLLTKAEMLPVEDNSYGEFYFPFDSKPSMRGGDTYHFAIFINGSYVGNSSAHIAWKNTWPDPVYKEGLTVTTAKVPTLPLEIHFVTSEIK